MTELKQHEIFTVAGGFLPAIGALIAVLAAPILIKDYFKQYNDFGHQIGETLYEYNHPYDPNG